ncbi:unnamed protein product [Somion occarium]|uniref:Uncharacterized protein n=1 Tax=Somion occarium TaxID=3059160 RepID=A0ABP1DCE5_9APHY
MQLTGKNSKFYEFCKTMEKLVYKHFDVTSTRPNQDALKVFDYYDEAKAYPLMSRYHGAWPVMAYAEAYLNEPACRLTLKEPDPNETDTSDADADGLRNRARRQRQRPMRNRCYVVVPSISAVTARKAKATKRLSPAARDVRRFLAGLETPQTKLLDLFLQLGVKSRTELEGISRRATLRDAVLKKLQSEGNLTQNQVQVIKKGLFSLTKERWRT